MAATIASVEMPAKAPRCQPLPLSSYVDREMWEKIVAPQKRTSFASSLPARRAGDGSLQDWLSGDLPGAVARLERTMIAAAMREADGNRARAARRLGIQRQLLYAKIERYGLGTPGADLSGDTTGDVVNPDASDPPEPG